METPKYLVFTEKELSALLHADEKDCRFVLQELREVLRGKGIRMNALYMQDEPLSSRTGWALMESLVHLSEHNLSDIHVAVYADLLEKQEKH